MFSRLFLSPILVAALVGIGTGFIAVGFIKMVVLCGALFFGAGSGVFGFLGPYCVVPVVALGGLLVGPLVTFLAPEAKGHGVPEVLKAIAVNGGRIRARVVVVKAIASVISLGCGFSVGREGPIVQVGAALGSSVARLLNLNQMRIKNLIACGAAGGVAAVFNAPIAGVVFASEVILKDFGANALTTVVVSAVSASVISRSFLGESPAFTIPSYRLESPWEIGIYLLLGLLSGLIAVFFIHFLRKTEDFWERLKAPHWLKPVLGGSIVGLTGVFFPQVFSSGFATISGALQGGLPLQLLLALILMKIWATSVSIASGSSGGVFAPLLFTGSVLGGAVGTLTAHHFTFATAPSGAYALAGMACVFAAAAHAPVTAILIVFELTDSYHLVLPVMAAVIIATSVSRALHKESIYTMRLKLKGIDVGVLEEVGLLGGLQVKDAMDKDFESVPASLKVKELIAKISGKPNKTFVTVDAKGKLSGMIRPQEIHRALLEDNLELLVAQDLSSPAVEHCFEGEPLSEAARQMTLSHATHLPVVDPDDSGRVIGILRSEHILGVYSKETTKRADLVRQVEQERLYPQEIATAAFTVPSSSGLSGRQIKDLGLPEGVRFSSIKRNGKVLLPHGSTLLRSRDRVQVALVAEQRPHFERWIRNWHIPGK